MSANLSAANVNECDERRLRHLRSARKAASDRRSVDARSILAVGFRVFAWRSSPFYSPQVFAMLAPVVLYEDNHLLVIDKPAGLTTQGALPGEPSAVEWARDYVKRKYAKPGNVFIGVVSRLDRDVSGVLVLARTSKGAARLNEQFRERTVEKTYWAAVEGTPPETGRVTDLLAEDVELGRMSVVDPQLSAGFRSADAQTATLSWRTLTKNGSATLLEVELETGRKHQIRVQMASRGWPIIGDRKYGSRRRFERGIALHARRLEIRHPTRDERLTFEAERPAAWDALGLPI